MLASTLISTQHRILGVLELLWSDVQSAEPACCFACCRSATGQLQEAADARSAAEAERDQLCAEKEQLLPQLEQARWQNRQLEKKLEEAVAGRSKAEEVCWLACCSLGVAGCM